MGFGGVGGSGGGSIASSSDVALNNPANNDVLAYDATTNKWKNAAASASGNVTYASLPAGSTLTVYGDVARPTDRSDITVQWVHPTQPAAMNTNVDIWLNT